jgi:uncharacterized membrane protein YeaQ/YmgE (transglycosylase-associated protein family)
MPVTGFWSAILIGLVVGVLARLLIPGKQPIGIILTLLTGIGAAFLGSFVADQIGYTYTVGIDWIKLLIQVVFAAIAVLILTVIFRNQINPSPARKPRARKSRRS